MSLKYFLRNVESLDIEDMDRKRKCKRAIKFKTYYSHLLNIYQLEISVVVLKYVSIPKMRILLWGCVTQNSFLCKKINEKN